MSWVYSSLACVLLGIQRTNCNTELQQGLVKQLGQEQHQSRQSWKSKLEAGDLGWDFPLSCYCASQAAIRMLLNTLWSPLLSLLPQCACCSLAICFNSPALQHDQGPPGYPVIHLCGIWECCFSAPTQLGKRVIKASEVNQNLLWWIFRLGALDAKRVTLHVYSDTTF